MNSLLSAIKAFVLKSRPAYKDYIGNGKYDIKKLPEECIPDTVTDKIGKAQSTADAAQSTADAAQSTADAARRKAQSTAGNISPGKTWTQSNLTSIGINAIYYADGIWVAGSYSHGLYYSQHKFAFTKTVDNEISEINQSMNQFQRIGDDVIINSSTPNSTKKFKITVDDTGTLKATEVT